MTFSVDGGPPVQVMVCVSPTESEVDVVGEVKASPSSYTAQVVVFHAPVAAQLKIDNKVLSVHVLVVLHQPQVSPVKQSEHDVCPLQLLAPGAAQSPPSFEQETELHEVSQ